MYSSKLSATQRSFFNFHCTICFEAFHAELRPPVILPCGHTFLCAPCSKRIKRCMECRTSLFITPPTEVNSNTETSPHTPGNQNTASGTHTRGWSRRGNYSRSPRPPSPPVKKLMKEQIPLPLPKNLLLISLMEMAQMEVKAKQSEKTIKEKKSRSYASPELLQLRTVASNASESSTEVVLTDKIITDDGPIKHRFSHYKSDSYEEDAFIFSSSDDDEDSDFDDDEDRVLTAVGAFSSTCGTYAVSDPNGLLVLPRKPKDVDGGGENNYTSGLKRYAPTLTPPKVGEERLSYSSSSSKRTDIPTSPSSPPPMERDRRSSSSLEDTYSEAPLPYMLEYGARVQVVTIDDGWVTLARNGGFLFVDSSQLVKVGNPDDKACKIEGMLSSLYETRQELNERTQTLNTIEKNLVKKLQKALQLPAPFHMPPKRFDERDFIPDEKENKLLDALQLASPKFARIRDTTLNPPIPEMAQVDTDSHDHLILPRLPPTPTVASSLPASPRSPPRRGDSTFRYSPSRDSPPNTGGSFGRRSSTPSSPSNAHGINFRTGFSGHTGLSTRSHARHALNRPAIRMMGEHRGIGGSTNTWRTLRRTASRDNDSSGRQTLFCSSSLPEG